MTNELAKQAALANLNNKLDIIAIEMMKYWRGIHINEEDGNICCPNDKSAIEAGEEFRKAQEEYRKLIYKHTNEREEEANV